MHAGSLFKNWTPVASTTAISHLRSCHMDFTMSKLISVPTNRFIKTKLDIESKFKLVDEDLIDFFRLYTIKYTSISPAYLCYIKVSRDILED